MGANPQPGFAADIAPLFRDLDRESMAFAMDLSDYESVREHSAAILGMTEAGNMPCDGPWPKDRVDLFRAWIAGGYAP